jgi:hypothetical protein
MHLLVEAEWGLPREQDVGVVGYGEFRPLTPTYPAAVITNNPPAPEATEAIRPGTVSDLAMLGEGVFFDLYWEGSVFRVAHIQRGGNDEKQAIPVWRQAAEQ